MFTTPYNIFALVATGAAAGCLGALFGVGGGVFLIPVLVLVFQVPMQYAVATSIVSVIATSSAVASANVERGTANMRLGMLLEISTVLGAIGGGLSAGRLSTGVMEGLFGFVLLPTALIMWRRRGDEAGDSDIEDTGATDIANEPVQDVDEALGGRYYDESIPGMVVYRLRRLYAALGISVLAGLLSGLLGVGGGIFKVPALHLLCNVPMKAAAATSNFMIGVTAAASAFLYFGRGEVRPALTASIVLGVLLGSWSGIALNRRVHGNRIRRLFAVLLAIVAIHMLYRAWSVP